MISSDPQRSPAIRIVPSRPQPSPAVPSRHQPSPAVPSRPSGPQRSPANPIASSCVTCLLFRCIRLPSLQGLARANELALWLLVARSLKPACARTSSRPTLRRTSLPQSPISTSKRQRVRWSAERVRCSVPMCEDGVRMGVKERCLIVRVVPSCGRHTVRLNLLTDPPSPILDHDVTCH